MKWEYLLSAFTRHDFLIEELNKLGEQGWEAVALTSDGHVLLKREKVESEPDSESRRARSGSYSSALQR